MSDHQENSSHGRADAPLLERQPRHSPITFFSVVAFSALILLGVFAALLQLALPK